MTALGSARTFGRYELVLELATSYLGPLWLARASGEEGRPWVALRRVRLGLKPQEPIVRLLSDAVQVAVGIDHELISKVLAASVQGSEMGIAQSYVEGVTLRTLQRLSIARKEPIPTSVAMRLVHDLLEALSGLHQQGAAASAWQGDLFGAVSPEEILVATSGRTLLLDPLILGAAAAIETVCSHSDRIAYTAPEQNEDGGMLDPTTDVFCAGVLLWELFTDRRLFMGIGRSVAEKVKGLSIPRLDQLDLKERSPIPAPLADIVARALERVQAARFSSAAEMLRAIDASCLPVAEPAEVAGYVEEIAEPELSKQRQFLDVHPEQEPLHASARSSPGRGGARPHRLKPPPKPGREHLVPAAHDVSLAEVRAPQRTLLGIAPPKSARAPSLAAEPPSAQPAPKPMPPLPDAGSLEELIDWEDDIETRAGAPLASAARPAAYGSSDPLADEHALDAELEEVYDGAVPVTLAGVPQAVVRVDIKPTPAAAGRQPGALAEAGPSSASAVPAIPGPSRAERSPTAASQRPGAAPQALSSAADAATVPLIHDHRFDGPGPRAPRRGSSFWGGIVVGALAMSLIAAVLVGLMIGMRRTGGEGPAKGIEPVPASARSAVSRSASVPLPLGSSAPSVPPTASQEPPAEIQSAAPAPSVESETPRRTPAAKTPGRSSKRPASKPSYVPEGI